MRILFVAAAVAALVVAAAASGRSTTAPTLGAEPSISGVAKIGNILTGDRGNWNGTAPITYTEQWLRCDEAGKNCASIAGATTLTYKLVSGDAGHTIRIRVTAKNADGSKSADSNETATVGTANGEPISTKPPVVSGFAEQGNTIHTTTGTWVGDTPITYSYQWQRCDQFGNACNPIGGARNAGYTVVSGDVGHTLLVRVTATNSKGESSAISEHSATVTGSGSGGGGGGGGGSVPVTSVPASERLVVDQVIFTPNPVTSKTQPIQVKIRVKDTKGNSVRGAFVFFRSTPIVTSTPKDAETDSNGWVVYTVTPESDFPLKNGYSVQFYVKAYKHGDPTLGGIYGSRLVQVKTKTG